MSSTTTDSQRPQTTSSGSRGYRSRYDSTTLPPAAHVSSDPGIVGSRFGWVEVISPEKRWSKTWNHCRVLTRCTGCTSEQWQDLGNLRRGVSKGCQSCSQPAPEWPKWLERRLNAAKQRCTNPKNPRFSEYGGRGIEFRFPTPSAACAWIVENLEPLDRSLELDRIDTDGHYEPGNLRFVTRERNQANRRLTVLPNWDASQWPYARSVVTRKLSSGMSKEQILEEARTAVRERRKNWRSIEARLASLTC